MKSRLVKIINRLIEIDIILVMILVPLYFAYFYKTHSSFQIEKIVIFKILTEFLLLLSFIKIIINKRLNIYINKKHLLFVILFFLAYVVTVIFSTDIEVSIWGLYWRQQGLVTQFYYLLFFVLLIININNRKKIERIINGVIIGSIAVCVFGILQFLGLDLIYNGLYGSFRITSTLGQPVFLGNYLVLIIPLIFYKVFNSKGYIKYFFLIGLLLNLFCLYLTYTRGAWLGFLSGLFLYLVIYFAFINIRYRKIIFFSIFFCVFSFVVLLSLNQDSFFVKRIKSIKDVKSGSLAMRIETWKGSVAAISEKPFFGYGPETQRNVLVRFYNQEWAVYEKVNTTMDRAHNIILDLLLQGGVFYLVCYSLFWLYLLFISFKFVFYRKKHDLLLFLILSLFSYGVALLSSFEITETSIFFYLFVAFIFLYLNNENNKIRLSSSKLYFVIFILLLFIFCFSVLNQINQVRADYHFKLARQSYASKNYSEMFNNYFRVFDYNDRVVNYKWFFAKDTLLSMAEISSNEALVYLTSMIDTKKINKNFDEKYTEAIIYTILGRHVNEKYFEKADNLFIELTSESPLLPDIYKSWGDVYYLSGDYDKAIRIYNIAIGLLPELDNKYLNINHRDDIIKFQVEVYRMMAICYSNLEELDNNLEIYLKIIKIDPYQIDIYKKIADIYYIFGDIDKAIFNNKRGYILNPNDYTWLHSIALLYKEQNEIEKAIYYAETAIGLSPNNKGIIELVNKLKK